MASEQRVFRPKLNLQILARHKIQTTFAIKFGMESNKNAALSTQYKKAK